MEINQFEIPNNISNEKMINKKHSKFNEDIIILDKSFYNSESSNNEDINKNPIFILTIELERGKNVTLEIFSNSDSNILAKEFCQKHNLDEKTFQYLKEKIAFLIEEFKNNKDIDSQIYINRINNDMQIDNKEFEIEESKENKNDYFNFFIDCKNKSFKNENSKSSISKGLDINNITIKKNNIIKHRSIIRNNTFNKLNKKIKKTSTQMPFKRSQSYVKSSNKNSNQSSKFSNFLCDKNKNKKDKNNSKINTYYKNYTSKSLNNIKIEDNLLCQNDNKKKINNTNREKTQKINEDSFINEVFRDKEKERKSRRKSPYFRSFISKNESFGKNLTNFDTHSSSKINTDTFITNNTSSRMILEDIKFNKENPIILNNKKVNNYGQYLFERSKITKLEKQNEISAIQRYGAMNEFKLCSFMPKTNIKKKSNIHSKYKNKQEKINVNEEKFNFKPKINNNYNTDLNFNQRQTIFNNLYKKRNEELKQYFLNSRFDEKGNELFKPKINSNQSYTNKEENINIFDKNYSYYKKYNFNKKQLYKKFYKNDININKICHKEKTEKILNDAYTKVFTRLFNDLDNDQDNLITSFCINTNDIPDFILKILEPILKELKDDNQTLNCEEFILVMIRLFEDTPLVDKQNLINYYRNKIKIENKNLKRLHTPNHYSYFINDNDINNYNIIRNNSSKSISRNNKSEKMAINHERKVLNNMKNIDGLNYNYNGLEKNKWNNMNIKNEVNNGLTSIAKYTFNNYLKHVKA